MRTMLIIGLSAVLCAGVWAQPEAPSSALRTGRVKYAGGGDWYNDPSAEVNLLRYARAGRW